MSSPYHIDLEMPFVFDFQSLPSTHIQKEGRDHYCVTVFGDVLRPLQLGQVSTC